MIVGGWEAPGFLLKETGVGPGLWLTELGAFAETGENDLGERTIAVEVRSAP